MNLSLKLIIASLLTTIVLWGCDNTPVDPEINLEFSITHEVDGDPLAFDDIKYTNEAGNTYSVVTLKYFISDITLHKADGSTVVLDDEHYVDATDPSTFVYSPTEKIANGEYSKITLTFGLNETKNVDGYFTNPPESNMQWPPAMGQGFHYMKLEGKFDSVGVTKNYNTHTGPSMNNPYFIEVTLPSSGFTADGKDMSIDLMMNINKWYESPTSYDFNAFGQAIMGNQTAQQTLQANGADVFSVTNIQ